MHTHSIDDFRHSHVFLGDAHKRNERKTWTVIGICAAMMVAEIIGGFWFGSVALIADGLHMSTHAGALLIAALAYTYSRRYADDARLAFGTGKLGDLAAFTSAIALAMIALFIGYESVERLVNPVPIAFNQAIPIAVVGLGVNLLSAFLLRDDHDHHHGHAITIIRTTIMITRTEEATYIVIIIYEPLLCMSWRMLRYQSSSLSA